MAGMQDIAAVSIDLDDTLWPVWPAIERAERRLYEWFQAHCPRVTDANALGRLEQVRAEIATHHPQRAHDYAFLRRAMITALLDDQGYPGRLADDAYEVFFAARNEVELYDDVLPALAALHERFPLFAATNGNADLERIGLGDYFVGTIRAADVGAAKPDPRLFAAVAGAAGVTPERILHVGDAPLEDIAGAHRAGMQTAWINRHERRYPPEHPAPHCNLRAFGELPGLLGL